MLRRNTGNAMVFDKIFKPIVDSDAHNGPSNVEYLSTSESPVLNSKADELESLRKMVQQLEEED